MVHNFQQNLVEITITFRNILVHVKSDAIFCNRASTNRAFLLPLSKSDANLDPCFEKTCISWLACSLIYSLLKILDAFRNQFLFIKVSLVLAYCNNYSYKLAYCKATQDHHAFQSEPS